MELINIVQVHDKQLSKRSKKQKTLDEDSLLFQAKLTGGSLIDLDDEGQICYTGQHISNYYVRILQEQFIDDGTNEPMTMLKVVAICKKKSLVKESEVSLLEFHNDLWVKKLGIAFQLYPGVSNGYNIVKAAAIDASEPQKVKIFTSPGWVLIKGKPAYITGKEVIG